MRALGAEVVLAGASYAGSRNALRRARARDRARARPAFRRSACHRGAGNDCERDSAQKLGDVLRDSSCPSAAAASSRALPARQSAAAEHQRHRRRTVRGGRHQYQSLEAGNAESRSIGWDFRRRRRRSRGRRADVPNRAGERRGDRAVLDDEICAAIKDVSTTRARSWNQQALARVAGLRSWVEATKPRRDAGLVAI